MVDFLLKKILWYWCKEEDLGLQLTAQNEMLAKTVASL